MKGQKHQGLPEFIVVNSLGQAFSGFEKGGQFVWDDNWDNAKPLTQDSQTSYLGYNLEKIYVDELNK
jgi:hypothetical protein